LFFDFNSNGGIVSSINGGLTSQEALTYAQTLGLRANWHT
jgi:hypothetical protein